MTFCGRTFADAVICDNDDDVMAAAEADVERPDAEALGLPGKRGEFVSMVEDTSMISGEEVRCSAVSFSAEEGEGNCDDGDE